MEHKFTKGQWKVESDSEGQLFVSTDKDIIAEVNCDDVGRRGNIQYEPNEEQKANAKLLASAPELLNTLDRINVICGNLFRMNKGIADSNNRIDMDLLFCNKLISEAIKKATE